MGDVGQMEQIADSELQAILDAVAESLNIGSCFVLSSRILFKTEKGISHS